MQSSTCTGCLHVPLLYACVCFALLQARHEQRKTLFKSGMSPLAALPLLNEEFISAHKCGPDALPAQQHHGFVFKVAYQPPGGFWAVMGLKLSWDVWVATRAVPKLPVSGGDQQPGVSTGSQGAQQ